MGKCIIILLLLKYTLIQKACLLRSFFYVFTMNKKFETKKKKPFTRLLFITFNKHRTFIQ